jgi:hypothetical protein
LHDTGHGDFATSLSAGLNRSARLAEGVASCHAQRVVRLRHHSIAMPAAFDDGGTHAGAPHDVSFYHCSDWSLVDYAHDFGAFIYLSAQFYRVFYRDTEP